MATRVEGLRTRTLALPLDRIRPWHVLSLLLVVQWAAVASLATTVRHNGWVWYMGGDQLWYYSSAWSLAHGHLPPSLVGYFWPLALTPIAAVSTANLVSALPAIVVLDLVVLLPIALLGMYGIGERIAGRAFGYLLSLLWVVLPYVGIRYALPGYHYQYTEVALPQSLGLTALADFPSTVALIVAAYFTLRALRGVDWLEGAAAGLAAGVAIGIKPSNAIFVAAPLVVLLAFRLRALGAFLVALAPALLTLALWKERGLGQLPVFSAGPAARVALGATASVLSPVHHYIHLDWTHLNNNRLGIREHFWSERLVDWTIVAGFVALLRRSRPALLLIGIWFALFVILKGTYFAATTDDASFFRFLMPAFPAFVVLLGSVVFLFPRLRPREVPPPAAPTRRTALALLGVAALLGAVAPLAVIAAVPPVPAKHPQVVQLNGILLPVTDGLAATARRVGGGGVRLSWRDDTSRGSKVFYHVLATQDPAGGLSCALPPGAAANCSVALGSRGVVRGRSFVDHPGSGTWTYRVGVAANWLNDIHQGDIYGLGPPVRVTVP